MKARAMESTVATLLFLAAAQPLFGQDAPMRFNPPDGSESRYRIEIEMSMEGPMFSSAEPLVAGEVLLTKTFHQRNGGAIEVGASVDSSTIASQVPGQLDLNLDGTSSTVTLDDRGRPTDGLAIEASTEDDRAFFRAIVTPYLVLPENQVEPGDSWAGTVRTLLPNGSDAEVELSYTLVADEEAMAEIAYEGSLDLSAVSSMNGDAKFSGTIIFDHFSSLVVVERAATEITTATGGMNVVMKVNRITRITG